MKKTTKRNIYANDTKLFQIGEAAKAMNITRRMILNYEDMGILSPAVKEEKTGYRYYTADNLAKITLIRVLQGLGMSLLEIKGYLDNTLPLSDTVKRLEQLRGQLETNIAKLHVRMDISNAPKYYWTILSKQTGYYKKMNSKELSDRTNELRDTYIEAVRLYKLSLDSYMFVECSLSGSKSMHMFIPVEATSAGELIRTLPEVHAICTYHRGPYENIPSTLKQLLAYVLEKGFKPCGAARCVFMEGPTSRGTDKKKYITQIAIPVEDSFDDIPRG